MNTAEILAKIKAELKWEIGTKVIVNAFGSLAVGTIVGIDVRYIFDSDEDKDSAEVGYIIQTIEIPGHFVRFLHNIKNNMTMEYKPEDERTIKDFYTLAKTMGIV